MDKEIFLTNRVVFTRGIMCQRNFQEGIGSYTGPSVDSTISVRARMGTSATFGTHAGLVLKQASLVKGTERLHMKALSQRTRSHRPISAGSPGRSACVSSFGGFVEWNTEDFLEAHFSVKNSGEFNFKGCRIRVPTKIRYDRLRVSLGSEISEKDKLMLELLEFGIPLGCSDNAGVPTPQKNHSSATSFGEDIDIYLNKAIQSQAVLGPFSQSPIPDLRYSPLMSVPKEELKRRIIVDFSYPPGRSINDGISKDSYLDLIVEFSLPSVRSMVIRVNELGRGCLLFKRDLKSAFRQFSVDPGDFRFSGLEYLKIRNIFGEKSF